MHHLPFNRMQLWTFPSQRDNEVSSGAENEAVVCPGGSWGLWKQAEPGLCRGGASPEIPPGWLLIGHQGLLGNTFYLCQKIVHFHLRRVITWQFVASEKRSLLQIVEKSHVMSIPVIWNPKLSSLNTQEQNEVCSIGSLAGETFSSLLTLLTSSHSDCFVYCFSVFQILSLFVLSTVENVIWVASKRNH